MGKFWIRLVLTCAVVALPLAARAADKIAVCSSDEVFQNSDAGKKASADLSSKMESKKKELMRQGEEISRAVEDFKKKAMTLSADAKAKQEQELSARANKLQEDQNTAAQQFDQEKNKVLNPLFTVYQQVVSDYAKKNGYSVVIEKHTTYYFDSALDITAEITKDFDAAAKKGTK